MTTFLDFTHSEQWTVKKIDHSENHFATKTACFKAWGGWCWSHLLIKTHAESRKLNCRTIFTTHPLCVKYTSWLFLLLLQKQMHVWSGSKSCTTATHDLLRGSWYGSNSLCLCVLQLKESVLIRTSSEEMSMFNFDYMCFIFSAALMIVLKVV